MKVINYLFQLLVFATVAVSTVITQGQSIDRVANGAAPQYCQDGELKCHGLGRIVSYCINNNWGLAKVCAEDEICEHISTVQCVKRDLPLHQGAVARVRDAAMPKKLDITPAKDKIMTLIEEAGEAVDGDEAEEPHLPFCYWCNDYKEDCLDVCKPWSSHRSC